MQHEQQYERHAAQQAERVEQAKEAVIEGVQAALLVEWNAHHDVREANAPQQRRQVGAKRRAGVAKPAPLQRVHLDSPLQAHAADNQAHKDEHQRQVKAGEQRGVPLRERRENRRAARNEPHLVAVPDRANRPDRSRATTVVLDFIALHERQQHANTEVKALQHEVAGEEHSDDHKPKHLQVHDL